MPVSNGLGETAAFDSIGLGVLYARHRDEIVRFLRRNFGAGPPDPDDVVQQAFERYAIASAHTGDVQNPRAFLFRTARNLAIDERRRLTVRSDFVASISHIADASDDLDAERVLTARQRWAAIERAIEGLDARSQEMLLMNRIQGLSCAEIARRMGCSPTLVKAKIAKALLACHRSLGDDEASQPPEGGAHDPG